MDCFVATAPRNDVDRARRRSRLEAGTTWVNFVTSKHDFMPSRRYAPELCEGTPSKEGAGNAGCALHPRSRVQKLCEEAHTSIQVQRRQSGIPCAMVLRLMACSPRRRILLVTVIGGLAVSPNPVGLTKTSADLTPATGARTTRFCRTLQRRSSCAPVDRSRETRPATPLRADAKASTASLSQRS
jgi:hypothetical protein